MPDKLNILPMILTASNFLGIASHSINPISQRPTPSHNNHDFVDEDEIGTKGVNGPGPGGLGEGLGEGLGGVNICKFHVEYFCTEVVPTSTEYPLGLLGQPKQTSNKDWLACDCKVIGPLVAPGVKKVIFQVLDGDIDDS